MHRFVFSSLKIINIHNTYAESVIDLIIIVNIYKAPPEYKALF